MSIRQTIAPGLAASMTSAGPNTWLDEPMYAINWFRAKRPRVYGLYGLLAGPSVFRTGGKLLLKGVVTETVLGDAGGRDTLLIVNYPSASSFLELLSGRFFQLVSPLRMMAVRRFSFVMHRRSDGPAMLEYRRQRFDRTRTCAVAIGGGAPRAEDLPEGVEVVFAGTEAVTVAMEKRRGPQPLPHSTPSLVVVEGSTARAVRQWANAQTDASCVVLLERVL